MTRPTSERPAPGDRRRHALLAAAYGLIAEKGLGGLRTRDVVERAGVNISMLHYYFGTKEGLLIAVVTHTRDRFAGSEHEPPRDTLREHLGAAWQSFQDDPRLAVVLQELALHALRDPATRAAFEHIFSGWNHRVEAIVRREQALGLRSADLDPSRAAAVVTSFIMGAMTQLGVDAARFDYMAVADDLDRWLARAATPTS